MGKDFSELVLGVAIDVETTGLDPETDSIVSVAAMLVDFMAEPPAIVTESKGVITLVRPDVSIPADATRIHGITDEMVADAPTFAEVAPPLRDYIGELPLVGHNVQFDKKFLNAAFKAAGVKTLHGNETYCTMQRMSAFARDELGERWRRWSLDDTLERLGLPGRESDNHHALEDAGLALSAAAVFVMHDRGVWNLAPSHPPSRPVNKPTAARSARPPAEPNGGGQISAKVMWWSIAGILAVVVFALAQTV